MAVQPFIQFIWGRVKLTAELDAKDEDDGSRNLTCWIYNWPINNKVLKFLKLKRDTANAVTIECTIKDIRTKTNIIKNKLLEIITAKTEGLEVSLPSSVNPAWVELIKTNKDGKTILVDDDSIVFKPGKYALQLKILYDGELLLQRAYFSVGNAPHELYWGRY
jgi:hypothetical protein